MIRIKQYLSLALLLVICLYPSTVWGQAKWLDTTEVDKGVVGVTYDKPANKRMKVMIQKGQDKYTYDLIQTNKEENFPLQLGNGSYKISLLEQTQGTKYRLVGAETIDVQVAVAQDVYLTSTQNVNWNKDDDAIKAAQTMVKGITVPNQKIDKYYGHMVDGYAYAYDKLATLPSTYLPNIDTTYADKEGICYDFSSLYASMLRSQGVPTKLVKGYATTAEGYHAWNEIYDAKTKEWYIVDTTYDLQVTKTKVKVKMKKDAKDYQKVYEY